MKYTNQQIRLTTPPEGTPEPKHFELVEREVPELSDGELLCRNLWLSLDPYMRSQIAGRHISGSVSEGDLLAGETVAEVVASKHADFEAGQKLRCAGGWQSYVIVNGDAANLLPAELPEPRWALGSLGMPGLTAWAGLTQHVELKPKQTLLLPAATGAVGCIAAGIAKHFGARVVGIVGSATKARYAMETLGLDACINRQDADLAAQVSAACPDGIDVYFDLVGGPLLHIAASNLAMHGHIILCGLMAEYNSAERALGPAPGAILRARGHISGLVVYDYEQRRDEFISWCLPLIRNQQIQFQEDITNGIENAPNAFCKLMRGENFGKTLVKLA